MHCKRSLRFTFPGLTQGSLESSHHACGSIILHSCLRQQAVPSPQPRGSSSCGSLEQTIVTSSQGSFRGGSFSDSMQRSLTESASAEPKVRRSAHCLTSGIHSLVSSTLTHLLCAGTAESSARAWGTNAITSATAIVGNAGEYVVLISNAFLFALYQRRQRSPLAFRGSFLMRKLAGFADDPVFERLINRIAITGRNILHSASDRPVLLCSKK